MGKMGAQLQTGAQGSGCKYHVDCLTCPFVKCVFDMTHTEKYRFLIKIGNRQGAKIAE